MVLEHGKWYWLHVTGPDGADMLLARYRVRMGVGTFMLPDDACSEYVYRDRNVHKWTVIEISAIQPPKHIWSSP